MSEQTSEYSIDTVLQQLGIVLEYDLDVLISRIQETSYNIDVVTQRTQETEYDIDSVLKVALTLAYPLDIAIQKTERVSILTDIALANRLELSYSIDVLLEYLALYAVDTVLLSSLFYCYDTDTVLIKENEELEYSIDVKLTNVFETSYLVDVLTLLISVTYPIDIVISLPLTTTYLLDILIYKEWTVSCDIDTVLYASITKSYLIDFVTYEPIPRTYFTRGWEAKIFIDGVEVGYARDVSIRIEKEIEEYYSIEDPTPKLIEHRREFKGTLRKAWVNVYYLKLLGVTSSGMEWDQSKEFTLQLAGKTTMLNPQTVILYGCRFTKARIDIPQSGVLEEEYDFTAKTAIAGYFPIPRECPPEGEYLFNPSFELYGQGWQYQNVYFYVGEGGCPPQHYSYAYMYPYGSEAWLQQSFGINIKGSCIGALGFMALTWYTVSWKAELGYSDGSSTTVNLEFDTDGWWQYIDLIQYLDKGKMLTWIKITANPWNFGYIDWVTVYVGTV